MPEATIKDLMESMVDPSADVVWNSVAVIETSAGVEERVPRTDEEWAAVRAAAIRLVEAPNLLIMPGRRVARTHEKSDNPSVELGPQEIEVLITKDLETWRVRAKALQDASVQALNAIDTKDAKALYDVGEQIDRACETCHLRYWYPNQVLPPGYEETAPRR